MHHSQERGENENVPNLDGVCKREGGQDESQQHGSHLRRNDDTMTIHSVGHHASDGSHQEYRELAGESHAAQQERRPGQPIHEPGLCDRLHPRAGQRNQLPGKEQLKVAVLQRAYTDGPARLFLRAEDIVRGGI